MADKEWECPTCGLHFDTENGMKVHHSKLHGTSISGVKTECSWCGKTIRVSRDRFESNENNFCSRDCEKEWRSEVYRGEKHHNYDRVKLSCDYCGDEIEKRPCEIEDNDHHFCDSSCFAKWHGGGEKDPENYTTVECEWCGNEFEKLKAVAKKTEKHFCDMENCYSKYHSENLTGEGSPRWKGGHELYYGPNWVSQREKAIKAANGECKMCGISRDEVDRDLHVHHIQPFRMFENDSETDYESANSLENLICLCVDCHNKAERHAPLLPEVD